MRNIFFAGLLASSMLLTACDSSDVASGALGVGIGIGISEWNNDHYDNRYDRRDGRWERRDGRYDRRDGRYDRRRNCNRYRCYNSEVEMVADTESFVANSFAQKHNIPNEAGVKIQKAFANVNHSGIASFEAIGLNEKALNSIMNRSLPAASSIRAMSQELNISEAKSQDLLQNLISEFDQQASNGQSNYWKACQAKGQWKTPQNAHCTDNSWNGCSPETGATLCY